MSAEPGTANICIMSNYVAELRKLVGSRPLILCAAGVIFIDGEGRILLQQRTDNGLWALPGGATEPSERLEETAAREAFEEVGLTCHSLELFNIFSGPEMYLRYPGGDEAHIVSAVYICRDYSGEITACPREVKQVAFFSQDKLPAGVETHPPDRAILKEFLK